jgi:hypothetical protein
MPSKDREKVKESRKNNYEKYKDYYLEKSKYQKAKNNIFYFEYKKKLKCSKCPENHISCLEFHHLDPNEKEYTISNLRTKSLKKAMKEMKKCIILCSNCHKKEHWNDNKIDEMKQNIVLFEEKKKISKEQNNICRGCGKDRDETLFVKKRCFCEQCYRDYQKEKMRERREKQFKQVDCE